MSDFGIDFDGTCVTHAYPKVGKEIGAVPVLLKLVANGHRLILNTMRSGKELHDAIQWFDKHNIPLFGIQQHPTQFTWTTSPKCFADVYIDDAAFGAPLIKTDLSDRKYYDWSKAEQMLIEQGLIAA